MLSACWLIGAYFLAVSSHKRGRLNTSVYGIIQQGCRKVVKSGGGNILDYVVPYTSRGGGVWGHAP